ncbi:MAG TPA: cation:proton antiporter [Gemmatimonadaceae bacterium]|nr:cation:proton antiporter [Gemmatimonadaceae bacterium]
MHDAHEFLRTFAVVLAAAGLTTVIFQRLRQPVVFGYLLAGMIVGPHVPIPVVANEATVQTLAETGVILLLFSLGLEFSLSKLIRVGPRAGIVAVAQSSLMIWIGYSLGRAFGWTTIESFYAGAIIAISSTTIIAKAFQEQRVTGKFTELVLGVLIIEDLIGIFLLAILTALSAGSELSASSLAITGMRLGIFLVALIVVGLLVIPRSVRAVVRMNRPETTLIASMAICFMAALLAQAFGYSVALGAFIAGSLVGESGEEKTVAHLIEPVRDVFAAIFFVAVGMLIDPALVAEHWLPVVLFTLAVVFGKVFGVTISAFFTGFSTRTALQTGMSLAQIGEFSFIIATVGLATGATRGFLYPIAVAVSAITTLITPWLIRTAAPTAVFVDSKLPRPIQTFVTLYGSWIERISESRSARTQRPRVRRLLGLLVLDVVAIALVLIGAALETERFTTLLSQWSGLTDFAARMVVIAGTGAIMVPLLIGFFRTARQLGNLLAHEALPAVEKGVDYAAAPRRALIVTLQLAVVIVAVVFVVAVAKPFYPRIGSTLVVGIGVGVLLLVLGITFWRTAADLYGHARAGAEVIVAVLAQQMAAEKNSGTSSHAAPSLDKVGKILPGLGDPVSLRIEPGSTLEGKTLAGANLRGLTGATVLAIVRGDQQVLMPSGQETLREGDVLAVVGSHEAVQSARTLIASSASAPNQGLSTE